MKTENKNENQNEILETANEQEFHDIVCQTPAQAEFLYTQSVDLINRIIPALKGQEVIQKLGRIVRAPSWFRVQLH